MSRALNCLISLMVFRTHHLPWGELGTFTTFTLRSAERSSGILAQIIWAWDHNLKRRWETVRVEPQ